MTVDGRGDGPDLLEAAWRQVAERGWRRWSAVELARSTGTPLATVYALFPDPEHLVVALARRVDAAMLAMPLDELAQMSVRERLFELVMRRLEAMRPYRAGLRAVGREAVCEPRLLALAWGNLERLAAWLLDAGGAGFEGPRACFARRALQLAYVRVLRVWLADDSADLARTMAELDRRLAELETLARLLGGGPAPWPGRSAEAA
jgi:AcrR family transcriptional regulator